MNFPNGGDRTRDDVDNVEVLLRDGRPFRTGATRQLQNVRQQGPG